MTLPYLPRNSQVLRDKGLIARDWDQWFQALANRLDALVLSGPDADPNGKVTASPGALYVRTGAATSALYVKLDGIEKDCLADAS